MTELERLKVENKKLLNMLKNIRNFCKHLIVDIEKICKKKGRNNQ